MGIEESLKAQIEAMTTRYGMAVKIYGAVSLFLLLMLGITGFATYHYRQKATELALVADAAKKEATEAVARGKQADLAKESADALTALAHKDVAKWKAAYEALPRPGPTPTPPAVTEVAQIEKDLTEFGFKPGVRLIQPDPTVQQASLLWPNDAVVAWSWRAAAQEVPALEKKLNTADGLIAAQTKETGALQLNLAASEKARDEWFAAHGAEHQRAEALQGEVGAMTKEAKAKRIGTYAKVGAALLTGYFVGKGLK